MPEKKGIKRESRIIGKLYESVSRSMRQFYAPADVKREAKFPL